MGYVRDGIKNNNIDPLYNMLHDGTWCTINIKHNEAMALELYISPHAYVSNKSHLCLLRCNKPSLKIRTFKKHLKHQPSATFDEAMAALHTIVMADAELYKQGLNQPVVVFPFATGIYVLDDGGVFRALASEYPVIADFLQKF